MTHLQDNQNSSYITTLIIIYRVCNRVIYSVRDKDAKQREKELVKKPYTEADIYDVYLTLDI